MLSPVCIESKLAAVLATLTLDAYTSKHTVEYGHEHKGKDGRHGEATDYRYTQWTPHFRTFTLINGHWHHTEDSSESSHKHRAQTAAACSDGRLDGTHTAFTTQLGIVNKHNTILHHDTEEHDTAHEAHHIEAGACERQSENHTGNRERHGSDDDEGVGKRLELSCQYNEHKHNDEYTKYTKVAERFLLILKVTGKVHIDAQGNVHILDDLVAGGHDIAHGYTGIDDGLDGIDTLAVLTLDGGGRESLHYSTNILDAYGCTISTVDEDVLDVLDAGTVLGRIAHLDVVLIAILTVE